MPYKDPQKRKENNRRINRVWRANRRNNYLKNKKCKVCGSAENLEVDHIDPNTKESSAIWTWSKKRLEIELKKCQVLCHDCHWEKTRKDRGLGKKVHGTINCYQKHSCRCFRCKKVRSDANKRAYQNRKNKYAK